MSRLKGKGLVYRTTMSLGIGYILFHFFGQGMMGRYTEVAPGVRMNEMIQDDEELVNLITH